MEEEERVEQEYGEAAEFFQAAMMHLGGLKQPALTKVLDLGCGSGELVKHLRSRDYDAYGCDITPSWEGKPPAEALAGRLTTISLEAYRLPFESDTFDAVISTSVLEHAQNKEDMFREIHRVLKMGGCSLHLFPGKWYLPVEPHTNVPLLNFFWPLCPKWWLALWAILGVRNEFQRRTPWRHAVEANYEYCTRSLSYWSNRRYRELSLAIFGNYDNPMEFFKSHGYGGVAGLLRRAPFRFLPGRLSGVFRMNLIAQKKVPEHRRQRIAPDR